MPYDFLCVCMYVYIYIYIYDISGVMMGLMSCVNNEDLIGRAHFFLLS